MATRLLTGTTLVDFDPRHIVPFPFGGEAMQQTYALGKDKDLGLLEAVSKAVKQDPLPSLDSVRGEPHLAEPHRARVMLDLLELVMHDVTKARPEPRTLLEEFCRDYSHGSKTPLQRKALACAAKSGVELRHIIEWMKTFRIVWVRREQRLLSEELCQPAHAIELDVLLSDPRPGSTRQRFNLEHVFHV